MEPIDKRIFIQDKNGNEKEMEILFTFEDNGKNFVLYYDPEDENAEVFASIYDDDNNLTGIENPEDWELVEKVFNQFMEDQEQSEEEEEPLN